MGEKRRIAAIWLPRWPIERFYRDFRRKAAPSAEPERPRALVRAGAGGMRLTACDEQAFAAGVEPGQLVPDAMALCPSLELYASDSEADRRALDKLAVWCGRFTPWVAVDPVGIGEEPDGLFLDMTGSTHLFGGEEAFLTEAARRFRGLGLSAQMAIASTPGAAWACARYGGTALRIVPSGGEADALRMLPIAALRLGGDVIDGLVRLGLKRVGDLYGKPRAPLAARFGDCIARRLDEALGFEPEPISPELPHVPYRASLAFAEGLTRQEHIEEAIRRAAGDLCDLLAREHQGVRRLELLLFRVDGEVTRLAAGTSIATHGASHLAGLFREKLSVLGDDFDPGYGIEAIALACLASDPLSPMQDRFGNEDAAGTGLEQFVDRVSNRFGADRVLRFEPRASHIPESGFAAIPALRGITPAMRGWKTHMEEHRAAVLGGSLPRPLRLLPAPEPVEVVAEVPEGPPRIFHWRRIAHRVLRAEGPERIAPEWWRGKEKRTRDYYRVEDADGRRFWLYRDGLYHRDNEGPRWFLHGVFE